MRTRNAEGQFVSTPSPLKEWLCDLFGGHKMKTIRVDRSKHFGAIHQRCECCGFKYHFYSHKEKHCLPLPVKTKGKKR